MKVTGIGRSMDQLGRIVIPVEIRRRLELSEGDTLDFLLEGDKVILTKHTESCVFCGELNDIVFFKDKPVCRRCISGLSKK